ncbi:CxC2 domain-containing protein [Favolaschia claudopus]|uniref:CxC2 domain-containing protein n=1 Tax=Favolaschia claudopus TaxID=2862362 RepID=A0AAW0AA03_9AGAR
MVKQHAALPTHWVQEWNGCFFERRLLKSLGLVIQLGHPVGYSCASSSKAIKTFTVIDISGIHNVDVNFCDCDSRLERRQQLMRACWWPATARDPQTVGTFAVIRLFHLLNCLGKLSSHDFLRSLEMLTNSDGLTPLPVRSFSIHVQYILNKHRIVDAFHHIISQYRKVAVRHVRTLMMKRAGRGHDPAGVHGTTQGELALTCRACPQPGRNLPDGWDRINWDEMPKDEDLRYKYFLFLAQDCNFRMINRNVSSAAKDPILADGQGYFVNYARYSEFLRTHVSEEEVSSCAGFQALFLANKKRVKGLRTTGIGGVTCAHHNMWRPNGIGPLQLGERYVNMDFIFWSSIMNIIILYLILSYDIACQYSKFFWTRMLELPADMQSQIDHARVWFKVPNFHLPPHQPKCHSAFSFHYMFGAGRTHGETVEQNWEFTNGAASFTKMMGFGTWFATLEDIFGFHTAHHSIKTRNGCNWRRLVAWRHIAARRMAENVKEGQAHRDAFEAFDAALREADPNLVDSWKKWVHEWESIQHKDGALSPFESKDNTVMGLREIRLKLAKEELLRSGEGVEVEREDTPSTFLIMGMEIEESQRYLTIDVKAVANPTDAQTIDFLKRRAAILQRIRVFRKIQRTYMPQLRRFLTPTQRAVFDSEAERDAEAIRLFMPSDLSDNTKRTNACALGLPEAEADLRVGEAREALNSLRQGLRARTMTNRYRLRHCTGQRMLTRDQGVLRQINLKIHKAKLRYRYARNALMRLRGHGIWEKEPRILEDADVRALNERALTAEEEAQRQGIHEYDGLSEEGGVAVFGVVAAGETRRTLSWIWYTAKSAEPTEAELVEALRVEWCKAYARMRRWNEDVVLVEEEMRRTIEYGNWSAGQWAGRAGARGSNVEVELLEGLNAYALEQEKRELRTCTELTTKWAGIREKGRAFLARETSAGVEVIVTLDEAVGRDGEDVEPMAYEDEGDDEIFD